MLTYVINTSENKTFDSERLFELAGYSKIRWMSCSLNRVKACAEQIYEKQNVIGAEPFRIAVIVDFYNFDRIRLPYGKRGFTHDNGVDMSLYMPYIETYLTDNLITYLENKDLFTADFEVYYVQNEKGEQYELLDSAILQVEQVLKGYDLAYSRTVPVMHRAEKQIPAEGRPPKNELDSEQLLKESEDEFIQTEEEQVFYRSFLLYCTSEVSLQFRLSDYPYGANEMTFTQFWEAFRHRAAEKNGIRRHFYITPYGVGAARTAFETLSLSLYLIRMYEREESVGGAENMEVIHLESEVLKEVLVRAWCKISVARNSVKKNSMNYYSLSENYTLTREETWEGSREGSREEPISEKDAILRERAQLPKEITGEKLSADELYEEIAAFATRRAVDTKNRNRAEFDKIMLDYLRKRDETRENLVEEEFASLRDMGLLKMTDRSPSQKEYEYLVQSKQKEISRIFERVLASEYIDVDYTEEKEKADKAYVDYKRAKAWLRRNIVGDILFMILAVAAMILPYSMLQLSSFTSTAVGSAILGVLAAGVFAGLFICAVIFQILPLTKRLNRAKYKLTRYYLNCHAKERYSFSSIRRRYEKDLICIEQLRYEIRQLKRLYEANRVKDENIQEHRKMLEEIEGCIATMLNHMDIQPAPNLTESVEGEFDVNKPIRSRENRIYQIFSIETIENMFPKKGSGAQ